MASETELARIIKRETEQTNPEIDPIELTPFALICVPLAPPAVNGAAGHCAKYEQALGGRHVLSQSIANLRPLEVRYDNLKNVYGRGPVATADNLTKHTHGSDNNRADDRQKSFAAFVGRVNTLYEFGAMCDFQYLPVRNKVDSKEKVLKSDDLHNQLIPSDIAGALSWWDQNSGTNLDDRQTLLLPSAFSRSTAPSPFILTRQIDHADQSVNLKLGQNIRKQRQALSTAVSHEDPLWPSNPTEAAVKDVNTRCKNKELLDMVHGVFQKRPIWTRAGLIYETQLKFAFLKYILARFAFYISSGPWGRSWCRFGYDPRKDPSAARYQTVSVVFKKDRRIASSTHNLHGAVSQSERAYAFRPGILPSARAMYYCLCDVHLPVAERFSAAGQPVPVDAEFPNPAPSQKQSKDTSPECSTADADVEDIRCDPVNGHLPVDALTLVRNAIRSDVYKTLGVTSGMGASAGGDDSMDAAFDDADDDGEQEDYDDVDVSFDDDT